jgi:hypothetical protein
MEPWIESVYRQAKGAEATRLSYLGRKGGVGVNTPVVDLIDCLRQKEREIEVMRHQHGHAPPNRSEVDKNAKPSMGKDEMPEEQRYPSLPSG